MLAPHLRPGGKAKPQGQAKIREPVRNDMLTLDSQHQRSHPRRLEPLGRSNQLLAHSQGLEAV